MAIDDGDIEAIMSNGDFDVPAVFSGSLTVNGWFTDATQQVSLLTNEIETVLPSFTCAASAITTVKRGNSVSVDGRTFTAERIEKIGNGTALVHLKT